MILTSQHFFDAILPHKALHSSQRALPHYLKTVSLLRQRLADHGNQASLSDRTAATVMSLAGHAYWKGDSKSAKHHMEGLCRIVRLRGGVHTSKSNPKLPIEMITYVRRQPLGFREE